MYSNGEIYIPDRKPPLGAVRNPYLSINRDIVGVWLMQEGSGNKVFDLSGNNISMSLFGTAAWSSGKLGSQVYSDNVSGNQIITNSPYHDYTNGFSIVYYFTIPTPPSLNYETDNITYGYINADNNIFFLLEHRTGTTYWLTANVRMGAATVTITKVYSSDWPYIYEPCCVVLTWDKATSRLYIKGILEGSGAQPTAPTTNCGQRYLGYNAFTNSIFFAEYLRCLSASEIAQLYREPFCGFRWASIEQLAAYYAEAPPVTRHGASFVWQEPQGVRVFAA